VGVVGGVLWTAGGALTTVEVGATGVVAAGVLGRRGAGRGLSAGVGAAFSSAGSDARGDWIATGGASEFSVWGLELDLVTMPTPNAAANAKAAATIALSGAALLNVDVS
jgi:hypothetical protein